jgi:hypothetical protein
MSYSAQEILFSKINEKWPKRNEDFDFIGTNKIAFHPYLDKKKITTKNFLYQLVDYAKNDNQEIAISAIVYKGYKCSGEQKNKFWVWEKEDSHQDELIHIYFNSEYSTVCFNIPLFEKTENERDSLNKFPGINSLQYKRKNKSVKIMQNKLIEFGFSISEKELGYYGKETCEAVKLYYRKVLNINSGTIVKNGKKFGPKAWERLFA